MNALYSLPPIFALRRYRPSIERDYPHLEPHKDIAVLIQTTMNADRSWVLHLIENPYSIIEGSIASVTDRSPLFPSRLVEIPVRVQNQTRQIKMIFNNCILRSRDGEIPLLKISEPCEILRREFYSLDSSSNEFLRFKLSMGLLTKEPVSIPKKQSTIPRHILDVYIESLLAKKEVCPITHEELTTESIRITPCGHAMSSSTEQWIVDKGKCPVCRETCSGFL